MNLTKLTDDLDIIQALVDEPNDVGGMTAEDFKNAFDEAGNKIKTYINDTLTVESDTKHESFQDQIDANDSDISALQTRTTNSETNITGLEANKTDKTGDHQGTWFGLRPSQAEPGLSALVDSHTAQLNDIVTYDIKLGGIDITGNTDITNIINNLLTQYDEIYLPAGRYKANVAMPAGKRLYGKRPYYDLVNNKLTGGTVIAGSITVTTSDIYIHDLAVENDGTFGVNGFYIVNDAYNVKVDNCITKVRDHGFLVQQSGKTANNIKISNCIAYNSVHGYAIKAKDVKITNCEARNCTTNGYVLVSDNMLGADKLSKSEDIMLMNCSAYSCGNGINMYSRDYLVSSGTVVVLKNVSIIGGNLENNIVGICVGDPLNSVDGTVLMWNQVASINIADVNIRDSSVASITFNRVTRCQVRGVNLYETLGGNTDKFIFASQANHVTIDPGIRDWNAEPYTLTVNSTLPPVNVGNGLGIYKTANTATTTIANFASAYPQKIIIVEIQDTFTTIAPSTYLLLNSSLTGNGKKICLICNKDYKWEELYRSA